MRVEYLMYLNVSFSIDAPIFPFVKQKQTCRIRYKACHSKTVFMLKYILYYKAIEVHVTQPILHNVLSQNTYLHFIISDTMKSGINIISIFHLVYIKLAFS